jgi:hypothetical protein
MERSDPTIFKDKMRMAANLDEIIAQADSITSEAATHERKDAIQSFNRGEIDIRVGQNDYKANVLTAVFPDTHEIFYDVVGIQPIKIKASAETTSGMKAIATDSTETSTTEAPGGTAPGTNAVAIVSPRASNGSISRQGTQVKTEIDDSSSTSYQLPDEQRAQELTEKIADGEDVEGVSRGTKFQLAEPVEIDDERDLVAVHNLTEDALRESLALGGMPSPSIAIVKAEQGHTNFGEISLVFDKSTIDPKANKANKVYGSDAWTPTRPRVDYEVNYKTQRAVEKELGQLAEKVAGVWRSPARWPCIRKPSCSTSPPARWTRR